MGTCGPQLIEKSQIGGRVQDTEGTAETLTAADFKTRLIVGATPEYNAGREPRNIARGTLTKLGSIEGKKSLSIPFSSEINTPDTFNVSDTANLDVDTIAYQSAGVVRVTFNSTPDLSGVVDGDYLTLNYCGDTANNGTWLIVTVNDGSDYVDISIRDRTSDANDEASDSAAVGDIQTNLEYQWALNACGMKVYGMSRIAIGTVTSGPFTHGETVTGDDSGATVRCIIPAANGDSYMYFEPLTGALDSDDTTLTGGTSGATAAVSSATPEVHGYYVQPNSNCQDMATIEYQEDGYAWSARDAMGNVALTCSASQQGFFEFNFQGPRETIGTKALTSSVTRSTEDPPVCKNADLTLGGTFEPVFSQFGFDISNTLALRENGNAADDTGYEGARITKRDPKFTLTCEHELAATYDFFSILDAGTKVAVEGKIGTSENKQFWFFADEVEFDELPLGDLDGIRTLEITGTCTGDATASGDDELEFAFIGN